MIPKVIHYCWFGKNPLPKLAVKCINSWKRKLPDYQIIEWNESNFDISSAPIYVRQAYNAKKWAFVTDYVRLKVVYDFGGIYLDTDVELLKNLDNLLCNHAYFGFEDEKYVATGLGFGAEKKEKILYELLSDYEGISFIKPDGSYDTLSCPIRNTKILINHGLIQNNKEQILEGNIHIYPSEYFSPISYETGIKTITANTVSIHWFAGSWLEKEQQKKRDERYSMIRKRAPYRLAKRILGVVLYEKIRKTIKKQR